MFSQLSKAENDVFALLLQGKANKEIADQLYVSEKTIKCHLTNIYKKLGVSSRAEAIAQFGTGNFIPQKIVTETRDYYQEKNMSNIPVGRDPVDKSIVPMSQAQKVQFIDKQFKIGEAIGHLHHMMKEVTKDGLNAGTVNAACNCVARINETIDTSIRAARFLSER